MHRTLSLPSLLFLSLSLVPGTARAQITFDGPLRYSLDFPQELVIADFDADGLPDLAIPGIGTPTLLGDGAGSFRSIGNEYVSTTEVCGAATGDFDEDGHLDLATVDGFTGEVHLALGDGEGNLDEETGPFPLIAVAGQSPYAALTAGDLDGDGHLDLAALSGDFILLNGGPVIPVLYGDGQGSFLPVQTIPLGRVPMTVASGDLDGNGDLDLVTVDRAGTLSILFGTGSGTFAPPVELSTGVAFFPRLLVEDLDADGDLDILTSTRSHLLGDGQGNFTPAPPVPELDFQWFAAGDMNGDDVPDLVVADGTVLLRQGTSYVVSQPDVTTASWIGLADFDGDGNLDHASASGFGAEVLEFFLGNGAGQTARTPVPTSPSGSDPHFTATHDLDGDGHLDAFVSNGTASTVTVLPGDGTGSFAAPQTFVASQSAGISDELALRDFTGDGFVDLLVLNEDAGGASSHLSLLTGDGAGGLSAPVDHALGFVGSDFATGDFNGDSHLDLAVSLPDDDGILLATGNGAGQFTNQPLLPSGFSPQSIVPGDFDDDGALDLAVVGFAGPEISLHFGDGAGGFGPRQGYIVTLSGSGREIAADDLDGDGHLDVVIATDLGMAALLGDGQGGLTESDQLHRDLDIEPDHLRIADLDHDGIPDLVLTGRWDHNVNVLSGRGDGTFRFERAYRVPGTAGPALGDLDGDTLPDLVVPAEFDETLLSFLNRSFDPAACFLGTVNAGAGPITDVLFVNGSAGTGPDRRVQIPVGQSIEVSLDAPPAGPVTDAPYAVLVWRRPVLNPVRIRANQRILGCMVSPTPLQPSLSPQPRLCLRGEDYPGTLCNGINERPAPAGAPWTVRKASGLAFAAEFLLQGIVRDESVSGSPKYSVTNAVILETEE